MACCLEIRTEVFSKRKKNEKKYIRINQERRFASLSLSLASSTHLVTRFYSRRWCVHKGQCLYVMSIYPYSPVRACCRQALIVNQWQVSDEHWTYQYDDHLESEKKIASCVDRTRQWLKLCKVWNSDEYLDMYTHVKLKSNNRKIGFVFSLSLRVSFCFLFYWIQ
jgi:hypothetical protein